MEKWIKPEETSEVRKTKAYNERNFSNRENLNTTGARHGARELALQGIYAWLLNREKLDSTEISSGLMDNFDSSSVDMLWFEILLNGVLHNSEELRKHFILYAKRTLDELSPIEHSILLIGSFELLHHFEIPPKVIINEAVELAKSFGGPEGFKFVNGVLDSLAVNTRSLRLSLTPV